MKSKKWQLKENNELVNVYTKQFSNLRKGVIFDFTYNQGCVWHVVDNLRGVVLSGTVEDLSDAIEQVESHLFDVQL